MERRSEEILSTKNKDGRKSGERNRIINKKRLSDTKGINFPLVSPRCEKFFDYECDEALGGRKLFQSVESEL